MIIPPNIGSEICFALGVSCAFGVMSRPVRRWLKFRYIVMLIAVLVIMAALSGK